MTVSVRKEKALFTKTCKPEECSSFRQLKTKWFRINETAVWNSKQKFQAAKIFLSANLIFEEVFCQNVLKTQKYWTKCISIKLFIEFPNYAFWGEGSFFSLKFRWSLIQSNFKFVPKKINSTLFTSLWLWYLINLTLNWIYIS